MNAIGLSVAVLFVGSAATAAAQGQNPSVDQLGRRLAPDVRIQVLDENRAKVEGRFRDVSLSTLRLMVKGQIVEVPERQIYEVRQERREPDGVLLGLGIGFAAGFSYVIVACGGASEHEDCMRAGSIVIGGPAAASGALIDLFNRHYDTVFTRRASSKARWQVTPILDARHKGVLARVQF